MFGKISDALRSLIRKHNLERDMNEELRFHVEMEIKRNIERGMSATDARVHAFNAVAKRIFGDFLVVGCRLQLFLGALPGAQLGR